jgi:transcriptional regulator with XRE-family HTH domain
MIDRLELKARRLNLKLSQLEFAHVLGCSEEHYNRVEKGRLAPSKKLARRYEELYGRQPLINITWTRGVECLFCHSELSPERLMRDDHDAEGDYYVCRECGKRFTAREAWARSRKTE